MDNALLLDDSSQRYDGAILWFGWIPYARARNVNPGALQAAAKARIGRNGLF